MRSQCRSNRGGRTRIASNEVTRIAALIVTLGAANGCTRASVFEAPKTIDSAPEQTSNPVNWSLPSQGHKITAVDPGTTQEQPDDGTTVTLTPTPVNPGSDAPNNNNSQLDPGPSDPIVVEPPPVVVEQPAPVVVPKATLVFNEDATSHSASANQVFSVQSVRELFIHTVWSDLKGEHTETRKFYSPSGELYYEKLTAFSTDIEAPVPFEKPVSIPHGSSVQASPIDANGHAFVSDYLSVGGTWISDRAMTGIWTVEIYLDDAAKPSFTSDLELVP